MRGAKGSTGSTGSTRVESKGKSTGKATTPGKAMKGVGMTGMHAGSGHVGRSTTTRKGGTGK